ncbi:aspartate carbamoyltransferase catalytic subunit [Coxiella endosymbiont of Amblyomma nuttalli]|uniref:aspartate carbamoyltransferase catalytic subunit n=1 Tax=Coxiella endosymbiont of Amblyomma nuttalli TaxID=2749996 RepID=UPI001BA994C1|nr:aspartate carbamoyltransferase catalytic subunit [Coxiella endosymbiont of Amblyomma nuttalli]
MGKLPTHLLSMQSLTRDHIEAILQRANYFLNSAVKNNAIFSILHGKIVATLFFEPSTRTRNSFEIAAKRLGAFIQSVDLKVSALNKGETILDTVKNLQAMGTDFFIIRHSEKDKPTWLAKHLSSGVVINAGDGDHQHPSQGLIDLMTIKQYKPCWNELCVTIIGDIYHSRVANSLIDGLLMMDVSEIRLAAPSQLLPKTIHDNRIQIFHELDLSLVNTDVIVTLRWQKERHANPIELTVFRQMFCLTHEKLALAKSDVIVMHPGPINREIEITSEVVDGQHSVILQQVRNGVAIRMAILDLFSSSTF